MVSNCTFTACKAKENSGGVDDTEKVSGCTFYGCTAEGGTANTGYGGGLHFVTSVERCRFEGCSAKKSGGGSDNTAEIWSCLYMNNSAAEAAGGANSVASGGAGCVNCTFVGNTCGSGGENLSAVAKMLARNCIFFLNAASDVVNKDGNYAVSNSTVFAAASTGDYHLRLNSKDAEGMLAKGTSGGKLDFEGVSLTSTIADKEYYYPGCYAYVPWAAKGLEVNVADDVLRPETAALSSLREVLQSMYDRPEDHLKDGCCTVKFAASLFEGHDVLAIPLAQAQMTADCVYPVVLKAPGGKRLVLDGGGAWRALYVTPRTKLTLENVTITNCLAVNAGTEAGARSTSGGALVNDGSLAASGCVFSGNAASGGSKIMPAPTGNGGAVLNRGAAVFERCTFAGNSAANGGAICNTATGRLTVVSSTFTGIHAIKGDSTVGGNGGAIAQTTTSGMGSPDTLLVNCTLTGNMADGSGGAIYAQGTDGTLSLVLADVLAVGNVGTDDLYLQSGVSAKAFYTAYGSRNAESSDGWSGTAAEGGKGIADLFADVSDDVSVAYPTIAADGQITFPLVNELVFPTVWVRHNADWSYSDCATKTTASNWDVLRDATDIPPRQQPTPTLLDKDQLGNSFARPPLGATSVMKPRSYGPVVPPEDDPRVICTTDPEAIAVQLAAVNAKADALARNGVVTVSFDPVVTGETVSVDRLLCELTGFTNVSLVIEGPITLCGDGQTRFFTIGEGNTVEFRDITFVNGCDMDAGGAIQGALCDLTCTRCEFMFCSAPYGGAVCLDYPDSRGLFTDCLFYGNTAFVKGNAVYNDRCVLTFIRTQIRPADVDERLRAVVEHSPRQIAENPDWAFPDYFSSTADAVRALESGSTLVLLSSDAEADLEKLEIPAGVTVVRRFARIVDGSVVVEGGASSLQDGIDMAAENDVSQILIMPGLYEPAEIPEGLDGLVLVGTDPISCVIDGTSADFDAPCLVSASENVTVSNLMFRAGRSEGAGGGVSGVKSVVHCIFDGCTADVVGGGVAGDGSTVVKLSLFRNCSAPAGAAVSGVTAYACTFVDELASTGTKTVDANSSLYACLAAGCTISAGTASYSTDDPAGDFVSAGEDYAIRVSTLGKYPADAFLAQAKSEGWADVFGRSIVVSIAGRERLFAGAFAPEMPDQRLQDLIDAAEKDNVVEVPSGTYGPARVPSAKGALTLRPEPGAKVTVDGLGLCPALTLEGAATVERLTITGGAAENGGGVCGTGNATVRVCVIVGNRATVSGGGVSGVTAQNCTFVGNAAPAGAAAANTAVIASIGATADQTLSACGMPVDWFTATEDDFTDFAHGDYSIPEANWGSFRAANGEYARTAYLAGVTDIAGRPLVRRVAGDYVCLAGAYAADCDDTLQRLVDFATGDTVEVPDGSYLPFVVERAGLRVVHNGGPAGCTVDGAGLFRGAHVTGADVTIEGVGFRNCAAESGGGVSGEAENLTVRNCTFAGCTANLRGGALFATNATAVVTGCTFTDNAATNLNSAGGAVYAANALVAGCFFRGNSAVCAGALVAGENVQTICCTFAGNTATGSAFAESASAAYAAEAGLTLTDCVLYNNSQFGFEPEGRMIVTTEDPFVASGAGDWRLRSDLFAEAVDTGSDARHRIAALRDAGAVMPGGGSLGASVAGLDALFAGAYGVAVSNGLQELIDNASPGAEISVPEGAYLPAVIPEGKTGLTLTGTGAAVIDGCGRFRCLTVKADGVTLKGLTFANGYAGSSYAFSSGGGVCGEGVDVAAVIDCTFTNCTATAYGGGIIGVQAIRGCRFIGNHAGTCGGGASQAVRDVIGSIFAFNTAGHSGAAIHQTGGAGRFDHCTVYANVNGGDGSLDSPPGDCNLGDGDTDALVDPNGGDFSIRPEEAVRFAVEDFTVVTNALAQGWLGADGEPLARAAGDGAVMTYGAINCWDMTLQAAVDGAATGETVEVGEGVYPPLFVGAGKSGVTLRAKSGARVTIDGGGRFRCVTDASQGLTLAGLVITNGVAISYGDFGLNGGGYCGVSGNGARLTGCTVAGCAANGARGGGVYGADAVNASLFEGNAAADGAAAARSGISSCTFVSNSGGATVAGGSARYSVFVGNAVADGTGNLATNEDFFVAGTRQPTVEAASANRIADAAYVAAAADWTGPDGRKLVLVEDGVEKMAVGAYAPERLHLTLQDMIDAAPKDSDVEIPSGTYGPATIPFGKGALTLKPAEGAKVTIDGSGESRCLTVEAEGVTLRGLTFANGRAAGDDIAAFGGGVYCASANLAIWDCSFTGCTAGQDGGGVCARGKGATVTGCTFTSCRATLCGGGIAGGTVSCSLFEGNVAGEDGSAADSSELSSCTFVSNSGGGTVAGGSARYSVFVGNAVADGTGNLATNMGFFVTGTRMPTLPASKANRIGDAAYVAVAADWTGPDGRRLVFTEGGAAAMTVGAYAPFSVTSEIVYLDWDEAGKKMTNATITVNEEMLVSSATQKLEGGKWYVVSDEITIDGAKITVDGSANLILMDGASLTVRNGTVDQAAFAVAVDDRLTIYGQERCSGVLSVTGGEWGAGLGGDHNCDGGTVTINGGTVKADGGFRGAGIGGGSGGAGGTVTINGGTVIANGGDGGAGIGGGFNAKGGTATINGGTVTAASPRGTGIGSGYSSFLDDGGTVTINGGTVTATGGASAAGIGGSHTADGGTVRINGGTVTASGGTASIGGGDQSSSDGTVVWDEEKVEKVEGDTGRGNLSVKFAEKAPALDLPPVAAKASFGIRSPSGAMVVFESADDAAAALMPGGRVEIEAIAEDDAANGGVEAAFLRLQAQFVDAARQAVAGRPWYSVETDGLGVELTLNEQATPKIDENAEVDLTGSDTEVSIKPSNVKPDLWYGLGRSETPGGEPVVEKWVQADADGRLPEPLTAPKAGASGFYRVIVTDNPPSTAN